MSEMAAGKDKGKTRRRSQVAPIPADRQQEIDDMFGPDDPDAGAKPPDEKKPHAPIFETASDGRPNFPAPPDLKRGFQEIVRDLYDEGLDVVAEYREIEDSLSIKGALTPGTVQEAANQTERMASRAFKLYLVALNEYEAYLREIEVIIAAVRDSAVAQLEQEKANGIRKKMITDADVTAMVAQLHPDEWDDVQMRRGHAKGMLDYLSNLSGLAKSRCFSVSKMQQGDKF